MQVTVSGGSKRWALLGQSNITIASWQTCLILSLADGDTGKTLSLLFPFIYGCTHNGVYCEIRVKLSYNLFQIKKAIIQT